MIKRVAAAAAGLVSSLLLAGIASGVAPEGARLALIKFSAEPPRVELLNLDQRGALPLRIAGGRLRGRGQPFPFDSPSWSPDGSLLVFSGLPHGWGDGRGRPRLQLFLAAADGGDLQAVPGTGGASNPVFSPDGHTIAFARTRERRRRNENGGEDIVFQSASVWLADLSGGAPRRLTPWRNLLSHSPSSFSPDGLTLAVTRVTGEEPPEALGLALDGTGARVLVRNAIEPVFSPDGSRLAFLRGPRRTVRSRHGAITATFTDLYTMDLGNERLQRLTGTPRAVELGPRWDPSGQRLVYTQLKPLKSDAAFLGFGDSIFEINANGSCLTKVLSEPRVAFFGAVWQPGPGREAGRIDC